MSEENKLVPRENGSNGAVELIPPSARFPAWDLSPREPHLYDYLLILRKHLWLILSFLLAVVTIVTIATFRMQAVYVATARIEMDSSNANILPFQGMDPYGYEMDLENYIETQSKILTSETLALQTIRSSGLGARPEFASPSGPSEALAIGSLENQKRPSELGAFLGSLSVKRVPNSRLVDVSFESTDPQFAARIVNEHIRNFQEQNIRSHYDETTRATTWLRSELEELKITVQQSEDKRIAYERKNQIWTLDDKSNITTQRLADLNKELTDAQSERMRREALFQFAKAGDIASVPQLRDNPTLQNLNLKRQAAAGEYSDALNQYGPNFPKVQRLQTQLKDIDQLIQKENVNTLNRIESEYRESRERENLLTQALDEQKVAANEMAERMVEYNILKREAEASKALYDGLMTKLKEVGISAALQSTNIRVVDPAMIPAYPSRPAKARNIALAFLVGLVGGIGLALMREYLDNTVKTPDDIETLARLPSLAVVPQFAGSNGNGSRRRLLQGIASNGHEKRIELVAQHLPKSQMSEAFRALRTSLLLSQPGRPPQVILVTSALPREGKTTAAANLAVTLAQLGDSTVLVDADLRKPGVGRLLNMASGKYAGLSSYLAGVSSLDLVTVPHPDIPNLAAIPTGPLPPNPADLLSSHKLAEAIAELRTKFKFVVIDSPPIMAATDAVILSVQTDGVLLVVRSGETPKEAFTRTRDLLVSVKCHILGVVLNAVDSGAPDYYYSYRYYPYSYGYGPQEAAESSEEHDDIVGSVSERTPRHRDDDQAL
ncbi:MAG TPA: polysaccharide biosynthesis tyrosine autokinase [Verrucomicrobiae bacterium]|jgi:succinoglycan biosynthesis transport protein ExoP|nr:polysaccharide biosynthesis tyrosine autokinase [Verrucomicrobiae bacterium]